MTQSLDEYYKQSLDTLTRIGTALSSESDRKKLLKMILSGAMTLTNSDGGTLYLVHKNKLSFSIIANKSLNINPSHILETNIGITAVPLYVNDEPNLSNIASHCYHAESTINIKDTYTDTQFDYTGTRKADEYFNYKTKSVLAIPLKNHEKKVIGVLQLINALDQNGTVIGFNDGAALFAESLASSAAIILTKYELIRAQRKLFESLLQLIANSIDAKSHHTSNHCTRVPIITNMIANALNQVSNGPLKDKHLSKDDTYELMISAWLHDCGKIITPDHVVNKSTKLETITDKIEMVNDRFEILKRDLKIKWLENQITQDDYTKHVGELEESQAFLNAANTGGEFLSPDDQERIRRIGSTYLYFNGRQMQPLLNQDEINNLCISRGTLNSEERIIIQNHALRSYEMLKSLPYPENLTRVPEIAGTHHERLDGKGYPFNRSGDDVLLQARILAIADIFEALTAADRPYKTPKPLSEVLSIMKKMCDDNHIDRDLFELFIRNNLHIEYGKQFLKPEQIDI